MTKLNYLSFEEKALNEIIEASRNNKLVFFIGAGFSKFSETDLVKIPSWPELIRELKSDLNLPEEQDFLKIAQLYFLKYGQHAYVNKVKSSIRELDPSDFHKKLFDLNPHHIITTNWDDLIEKTSKNMGLAYDVISSDTDLAHSQLDKKIIKMHGDFGQHNFVFKEDDYLQYSQNFPLIESYIKGVFSTHTIVFLGYSYSDYNLKQIVSWIRNISKATPQKYLFQEASEDVQAQYLRNHGISSLYPLSSLSINVKEDRYKKLYSTFFNDLKTVQNPNDFIEKVFIKVSSEIDTINANTEISDSSKKNQIDNLQRILKNKITEFFEKKFHVLSQYNVLHPEQISRKFTNCTVDYKSKKLTLVFHDKYLTGDFNEQARNINNIYIKDVLNNSDYNSLQTILNKALIGELNLGNNTFEIKNRLEEIDRTIIKKMHFNYERNDIEVLLLNKEYKKLLEIFLSKVQLYLKEKNYIMSAINMANYDYICKVVDFDYRTGYSSFNKSDISEEIIELFKPFDYKNKLRDFPIDIQDDLQDLQEILELKEIYNLYYRLSIESQKNQKNAELRTKGGMAWDMEEYTFRAKLYPYIYFFLGNEIIIENLKEIKNLFESNMLASLYHYFLDNKFYVNISDLFIIIKYCDSDKLTDFTTQLIKDKNLLKINTLDDKKIISLKVYLLRSLKNICQLFSFKDQNSINTTDLDRWFNNVLIILGLMKWSDKQFNRIIDEIIPVFKVRTWNIKIYESFQYLLYENWHLYEASHSCMHKILDVLLQKIVINKYNGFDEHILRQGTLRNIYTISMNKEHLYENDKLVKEAIDTISKKPLSYQKFFTDNLLLNIKNIGSETVKALIDEFVIETILNSQCEDPKDYLEKLNLIANGYSVPNDFIESLEKFIDEYNRIDLEVLKVGIETELPRVLEFLIKEKNMNQFTNVLNQFEQKVRNVGNVHK